MLRDNRQQGWFWLENELVDREDLTIYEKIVYSVLVRYSDKYDSCFPSYKKIASKAGCSDRKVKAVIQSLLDKKIISKQTRKKQTNAGYITNDSNIYTVKSIKPSECDALGVVNDMHQGGECGALGVVNDMHTNNTYINNTQLTNNIYSRVIDKLNKETGKNYKSTTQKTQSLIRARENEGFTEEDFYKVITNKKQTWMGTDMEKYLRPETLFGTKFEAYLNENINVIKKEVDNNGFDYKTYLDSRNKK